MLERIRIVETGKINTSKSLKRGPESYSVGGLLYS